MYLEPPHSALKDRRPPYWVLLRAIIRPHLHCVSSAVAHVYWRAAHQPAMVQHVRSHAAMVPLVTRRHRMNFNANKRLMPYRIARTLVNGQLTSYTHWPK